MPYHTVKDCSTTTGATRRTRRTGLEQGKAGEDKGGGRGQEGAGGGRRGDEGAGWVGGGSRREEI